MPKKVQMTVSTQRVDALDRETGLYTKAANNRKSAEEGFTARRPMALAPSIVRRLSMCLTCVDCFPYANSLCTQTRLQRGY